MKIISLRYIHLPLKNQIKPYKHLLGSDLLIVTCTRTGPSHMGLQGQEDSGTLMAPTPEQQPSRTQILPSRKGPIY